MSRSKKLSLMLAALAVIVAACVILIRLTEAQDSQEDEGEVIFSLNEEDVTQLGWTYDGESVNFANSDGEWQYTEDEDFPVEENYISTMLSALSEISASRTIEAPDDVEQYGLEEPVCEINVSAEEETVISIGDENSMGGSRYISIGDGNVYMVDSSLLDAFAYGLYDVVQKEEIPSMNDVRTFTVERGDEVFEIEYNNEDELAYSDEYVWFAVENSEYTALDTDLSYDLVDSVVYMAWGDCVSYQASEEDISAYGLDDPQAVVSLEYMNSEDELETFELEVGDYVEEQCYARLAGSDMIYMIDSAIADALVYTDADSLLPDEVILLNWDIVTGADITVDGQTYSLEKTETPSDSSETSDETSDSSDSSGETVWKMDEQEISMDDIVDALDDMMSSGSDENAEAEGSAEISFVFYQDSENFAEVSLQFYKYDSDDYIVSLDGQTRLLVSKDTVDSLVDAVNELFE